jgi:hypothetical protein
MGLGRKHSKVSRGAGGGWSKRKRLDEQQEEEKDLHVE